MRFERVIHLPTAWSSAWGPLAVHLFEGPVHVHDMDRMQSIGARWNDKHPGKRVELVVIFPSDTRMSHEERARMATLIQHGAAMRAASATVILAQGLLASMQRSVLTGLMMLAPPPHPAKVFGDIDQAVRWLLPELRALSSEPLDLPSVSTGLSQHIAAFMARVDRPSLAPQA